MRFKVHVYENLSRLELDRLAKQETSTGGGAQSYMYQLRCRVKGTTLRCEDWLYLKLKAIVESRSFGGYQDRLPFAMHIEMLEELGRLTDVADVQERRRTEAASLF